MLINAGNLIQMKKLAIIIFCILVHCSALAMEQLSNNDLDNIIGASMVDPPMIAQEAGGNATMLIAPVTDVQRTAEDVQTLTRPGTLVNKVADDTQTVLAPVTTTSTIAGGFSF